MDNERERVLEAISRIEGSTTFLGMDRNGPLGFLREVVTLRLDNVWPRSKFTAKEIDYYLAEIKVHDHASPTGGWAKVTKFNLEEKLRAYYQEAPYEKPRFAFSGFYPIWTFESDGELALEFLAEEMHGWLRAGNINEALLKAEVLATANPARTDIVSLRTFFAAVKLARQGGRGSYEYLRARTTPAMEGEGSWWFAKAYEAAFQGHAKNAERALSFAEKLGERPELLIDLHLMCGQVGKAVDAIQFARRAAATIDNEAVCAEWFQRAGRWWDAWSCAHDVITRGSNKGCLVLAIICEESEKERDHYLGLAREYLEKHKAACKATHYGAEGLIYGLSGQKSFALERLKWAEETGEVSQAEKAMTAVGAGDIGAALKFLKAAVEEMDPVVLKLNTDGWIRHIANDATYGAQFRDWLAGMGMVNHRLAQ